jgi:hypothetical protein
MARFTQAEIRQLFEAMIGAGFHTRRNALSQGIHPLYWGALPEAGNPIDQLMVDLGRLNADPPLANGTVPMAVWLENLATLAGPQQLGELAVSMHTRLSSAQVGRPVAPPAKLLHESKEAIILLDERLPVAFLRLGAEAARKVALAEVPCFSEGKAQTANGKPRVAHGTAWLLTPGHVMTNHHVIAARDWGDPPPNLEDLRLQAKHSTFTFDYDTSTDPGTHVRGLELAAFDSTLDYAIVRIEEQSARGQMALRRDRIVLEKPGGSRHHVPVNIVQHSRAEAKIVGFRSNLVTYSGAEDLRYFTDTDKGASGSPVCDDLWRVVALHRATTSEPEPLEGFFQGRKVAHTNVGTQITAVLDHLEQCFPQLWAELRPRLQLL